jgi:thioredoxin reductase
VTRSVPRARADFRARVAQEPRIEVLEHARVTSILGSRRVEGVRIENRGGAAEREAGGVVVKVGMMPNTEWCAGRVELDLGGHVRVDDSLRTRATRVWAAGDCAGPSRPSIAAAIGQGATALASIFGVLQAG